MNYAALRTAIERVGQDAMDEPDAGNREVQFKNAVRELRKLRAQAMGAGSYSKQNRGKARELRLRAERRIGQLLIVMKKAGLLNTGRAIRGFKVGASTGRFMLKDVGVSRKQSQNWQKLARKSNADFEAFLSDPTTRLTTANHRLSPGPKIHSISLSGIEAPPYRLRVLRPDVVDALAELMRNRGLINPITVGPRKGLRHELRAGHHRLVAARKLGWEKIDAIVSRGTDAIEAELIEIDENLIRANLTPAEQAAHHVRRKELYEQKHGKAKAKGAHEANRKMGRRHDATDNLSDAYTTDAAKTTGKNPRSVRRDVARGENIPNIAELAGTSLDQGTELDALAKLKDIAPDRQAELIEKAKSGEKVSAKAAIKKAQQEKREAEFGDAAEPELTLQPIPEPSQSPTKPASREPASSDDDDDAVAAQDLAPASKRDDVPPTARDQPTPTPEEAAAERRALYARNEETEPDGDGNLPIYFGPEKKQLSLDEKVENLIFLVEHQINGLVPQMRAAGRLPDLFRRCRKVIDKLEAEAAAHGEQTEAGAEPAAVDRATPTQEEMPASPRGVSPSTEHHQERTTP